MGPWFEQRMPGGGRKTAAQAADVPITLFCFPYAGGGAACYRGWHEHLPGNVIVCPVQLPGRESRWREPSFTRVTEMIDVLIEAIAPDLDHPFALFGHSMGALIAFELARHLRRNGRSEPRHLFMSGARAPHLPPTDPPIHDWPDDEFLDELTRRHNGIPAEVREHPELLELVLPTLKADLELCETYQYRPEAPLACPITVFGGDEDHRLGDAELDGWRAQTTSAFSRSMFAGDHFFISTARPAVLQKLGAALEDMVDRREGVA